MGDFRKSAAATNAVAPGDLAGLGTKSALGNPPLAGVPFVIRLAVTATTTTEESNPGPIPFAFDVIDGYATLSTAGGVAEDLDVWYAPTGYSGTSTPTSGTVICGFTADGATGRIGLENSASTVARAAISVPADNALYVDKTEANAGTAVGTITLICVRT